MTSAGDLLKQAQDKVIRARVQLLLKQPFFGVLATYLEPKPARLAPYSGGLGTDGKFLYFQPDKLVSLPEEQLEGIIAHELMHIALGHLWRRETREPLLWNIATDYAVNAIVKKDFELPEWILYAEEFENKCAEEIYNLLPAPACPKCGSKNIKGLKYRSEKGNGGSYWVEMEFECQGCGKRWKEKRERRPGDSGYPMKFESVEGDFPTPVDDHDVWDKKEEAGELNRKGKRSEELEREWKGRIVRAAQIAKSQGNLPCGLLRFIEDLLYPKLGWRQLLWQYTMKARGPKQDWRRPNKKWIQYGIYYPRKRERRLEIAAAVDTSGSISDEELKEFLGELRGIISTFKSFRVRMLACDAGVHTDIVASSFEDFDSFRVNVKGGGGTDFRPVFEAIKGDRVQALIYLTDAYGDYPEEAPAYDVVWVVSKNGDPQRPPFGRVIQIS
ncbi:MAG: VWA-like domain-containing protein [Candidatus Hadarchaeum sp.]|uniref:vWA domain-containing protein n=1 Tax=Candidatus Hadarchaeum sp. TaxID=2883567 RepID=UPI00317EE187